jgi:two-component system sensor histidine kinase ChiS
VVAGVGAEGGQGGEEEGDWAVVEVSVSDTGIGIDPAIVSKLFRPYAQAAVSTMREYGGSGLGLAITNQIVRLMGGSVYVETEIGKGSKFTFTVPLQIVKDPQNASEPSPPPEMVSPLSPALRHPSPPHEPSPMVNIAPDFSLREDDDPEMASEYPVFKVLVVDDSSINRSILISMMNKVLRKGTYTVAIATNGQEAVDICQKDPEFDLIFMDIVMPVMNGWDACRRIRADGFQKHIVITTANQVTGEAATEIAAVGASDAISKPFSKDHIQKLLLKFGAGYALKT